VSGSDFNNVNTENGSDFLNAIGSGGLQMTPAGGTSSSGLGSFLTSPSGQGNCIFSVSSTNPNPSAYATQFVKEICGVLPTVPPGFSGHIADFIFFVLYPISLMLSIVAVCIGMILIIAALHRLRHHHSHHSSKQYSLSGTVAYFIAGAILIQYGPILHLISSSTFFPFYTSGDDAAGGYMPTVWDYVQVVTGAPGTTDPSFYIQELTFSLLLVVGLFSFLRGVFLLVKLGESGGAEGGVLPKAIAHIVAGIIAVNAQATWALIRDMVGTLNGS